jgi:hypothetical protein
MSFVFFVLTWFFCHNISVGSRLLQYWKIMNHLKDAALVRQHFLICLQFWLRGRTCVTEWYNAAYYHCNFSS